MSQQYRYPNSASVTVAAVGTNGATAPTQSMEVAGKDGSGNLQPLSVNTSGVLNVAASSLPLPSGAATEATLSAMSAKLPASLGIKLAAASLSIVLASDGILPLPTGAATESTLSTLNGKITACNTGAVVVSSSALPSGAATEATLSTLNGKVTAVNTGAVVISSSALPSGAATEATLSTLNGKVTAVNTGAVVVSSSALPSGAATESTLSSLNAKVTAVNTGAVVVSSSALPSGAATDTVATANGVLVGAVTETAPATDTASSGLNGRLQRIAQRITSLIALIPASLGQKTMANSFAVAIASDQSALTVSESGATTGTASNVASSASSVTVLASNASRKGATVFNDSTAVLYLKFGATASATSYAVQIPSNGYYEVPFKYTGIIDGIWSAANGNARVTELT